MTNFIISRIIQTIVVLFLISMITFLLVEAMPGDPVVTMLGRDATPEQIQTLTHQLRMDRPIYARYAHWFVGILHGDLGESIFYNEPVSSLFAKKLRVTGHLASLALILSVIVGIITGIISAVKRGSGIDQVTSLMANVGIAIPTFWLGILGIYLFGLKLKWLPIYGWTSPFDDFWLSSSQALMPVVLLAVPSIAVLSRQTRSSMLEVIHQEYIRTAWAKGLKQRMIIMRHAIPNALMPVVTLIGLQVRLLFGGSVLVEQVFNIPGMGRLLVDTAFNKDFPVIQGGVLVIGLIVCLMNLLVDISYGWLDPRVRYE
jgi:peptide/nickel transport system permease protein